MTWRKIIGVQGSLHTVSNLGLFDKLKSRVGLNKKKVNSSDGNSTGSNSNSEISNVNNSNGNGNTNKNGNTNSTKIHSDNGKLHNSNEIDIDDNVEYIGRVFSLGGKITARCNWR